MPFSCLSEKNIIYAEDFSASEWEDIKLRAMRGLADLKLPCCYAKPSLRSGLSRVQHFAHYPGASCKSDAWSVYSGRGLRRRGSKSESFDHQRIKEIIREVAEKVGWFAKTEYEGQTSSGDRWTADVYAEKGEFKVVFEIQVSPQQFSYYRIRQQRYRDSGIKCIWLSSVMPEFSDEEIPVFELSKSKGVFVIDFPSFFVPSLLKLPADHSGVSLGEFIQHMLNRLIIWEMSWVNKHDSLANIEEWHRCPKRLTQHSVESPLDDPEYSSGCTFVKDKESITRNNLRDKAASPQAGAHLRGIILPIPYKPEAQCLTLIFFAEDGTLIDYWFRGDIGACKSIVSYELPKLPSGAYAEVRGTMTRVTMYRAPPQPSPPDYGTETTIKQLSFFD